MAAERSWIFYLSSNFFLRSRSRNFSRKLLKSGDFEVWDHLPNDVGSGLIFLRWKNDDFSVKIFFCKNSAGFYLTLLRRLAVFCSPCHKLWKAVELQAAKNKAHSFLMVFSNKLGRNATLERWGLNLRLFQCLDLKQNLGQSQLLQQHSDWQEDSFVCQNE